MGLAESSFSKIYVGRSTTEGTEPATYQEYTVTGHSLSQASQTFQGEFIDPNRKPQTEFRFGLSGQGSIDTHWLPTILDDALQVALVDEWSAAVSLTPGDIDFGAPTADGQTITDGASGNAFAGLSTGDAILIAGAGDAGNNGARIITAKLSDNAISVFVGSGSSATASTMEASVTFDHNGRLTIGTTKSFLFAEREMNDGTQLLYTEFFQDLLCGSFQLGFNAAQPSRVSFGVQGDAPSITTPGTVPATKQRGGSDASATTAGLIHGMGHVQALYLYHAGDTEIIKLVDPNTTAENYCTSFSLNLNNDIGRTTRSGRRRSSTRRSAARA